MFRYITVAQICAAVVHYISTSIIVIIVLVNTAVSATLCDVYGSIYAYPY